jgi:uncharacterized NAD-dependent epimerase/dehydratase family protein
MIELPEGNAIVYCEGAFNTTNGKTAHGLVRRTERYNVLCVVDSRYKNQDAGQVLDGKPNGISIVGDLKTAIGSAKNIGKPATHFIMGLTPDGGRLDDSAKLEILNAIELGLNIDSGAHDFFSEDTKYIELAQKFGVILRDIRKPPKVNELHFFTGKIEEVRSLKIAYLGTDSAVGKRTSAWILAKALNDHGIKTEMIGTGQTSWMQGVKYGIILDSLVNDFVAGELEHVIWTAWDEMRPEGIIIEGQGSIMNPAYPGGFEILAAGRPDIIIIQHPPMRLEYDGFPGYPLHPIEKQIKVIEMISDKPVIAVTINHECIKSTEIKRTCSRLSEKLDLPVYDILMNGADDLVEDILPYFSSSKDGYL